MADITSFLSKYAADNPVVHIGLEVAADKIMHELGRRSTSQVYQAMRKEVENMSWPEKAMIAAGHETDKLGAGTRDFIDSISGTYDMMAGNEAAMQAAMERQRARAIEQAALDKAYAPFKDNAGLSAQLTGSMLPYVLNSVLFGPLAARGAGTAISTLGKGITKTAKATGQASKTTIQKLAEMEGIPGYFGKRMQKEWVEPIAKTSARMKGQIPEYDPFRPGAAKSILGDIALGGIEGGLHYDNTIGKGALASGMGSITGQVVKPMLHKSPSFYTDNEQRLIEWGKDNHYKFLPGMETGHRGHQMFENDLRTSNAWTDVVKQIDRNNDFITNRIAFEQLGIPPGQLKELSPSVLKSHMDSLSKEYEDLISSTRVRFEPTDFSPVLDTINSLKQVGTKPALKTAASMEEYLLRLEELRKSQMPVRDPMTGKLRKSALGGKVYQDFRKDIKSQISQAYDKQDTARATALNEVLKVVDTGIERGVKDFGGEAGAAKWKDLNERWALSNLVMEKGMNPLGFVDGAKLGKYLLSEDPQRFLMETAGPRMTELQKAAKLSYMTKNQANNGLGNSLGYVSNPEKKSAVETMLSSPLAGAASFTGLPQLLMGLYKRGWPSTTGMLGFDGSLFRNAPTYTRSLGQASQFYPSLGEALGKAEDYISELPSRIKNRIAPAESNIDEFLKRY